MPLRWPALSYLLEPLLGLPMFDQTRSARGIVTARWWTDARPATTWAGCDKGDRRPHAPRRLDPTGVQ